MIDLHCHILPGADHGPETYPQALELCRCLYGQGVKTIVATPHQLGVFEGMIDGDGIIGLCREFGSYCIDNGFDVEIIPGAEVRLDERIPRLLDERKIITLGDGGKYLLLELIPEVFIDIDSLIDSLAKRGVRIVLSHPERYEFFWKKFDLLRKWMDKGVLLQVTASALLGFGYLPQISKPLAFEFLSKGLVAVVASDAHDLELRAPYMQKAFELVRASAGKRYADVLFEENPRRLLAGLEPVYV